MEKLKKYNVSLTLELVSLSVTNSRTVKDNPVELTKVYAKNEQEAIEKATEYIRSYNDSNIGKHFQFNIQNIIVEELPIDGELFLMKLTETVTKKSEVEIYVEAKDVHKAFEKVDADYSEGKHNQLIDDSMEITSMSSDIVFIRKA